MWKYSFIGMNASIFIFKEGEINMNILVAGFDPFGDEQINPAMEILKLLPKKINGSVIDKLEIPTVFHKSKTVIEGKLQQKVYDIVLVVGQAGGRFEITPERIAMNIDDARIPDNEGNQPIDEVIQITGAQAYFSNLPVKSMTAAIKAQGIPARLSNTAGTFVCNHILYQLGFLQDTEYPKMKFGFIHVPFIPEQVVNKVNQPSMSLEMMVRGLQAAIATIVDTNEDIKKPLGEIQ